MTDTRRRAVMRRYGGDWQPVLEDFADAVAAMELPDTAWAVLSCPVDGMDLPEDFLALIDRDRDGRVRVDDVRAAVAWTAGRLHDWAPVTAGADVLKLDSLTAVMAAEQATGRALVERLDKRDSRILTLTDLRNSEVLCQCGDRDGDGVVPLHCIEDERSRAAAAAVLVVAEPALDRHGKPGVAADVLDAFVHARDAWREWRAAPGPHLPWGEDSLAIARTLMTQDDAVTAWFTLATLARVDPQQAAALVSPPLAAADPRDPQAIEAALDGLPIASLPAPDADDRLGFDALRPGSAARALRSLAERVFEGADGVHRDEWDAAVALAERVAAWHDEGEALTAARLTAAQLESLDDEQLSALRQLCALDADNRAHLAHLAQLETLLVYQRDLFTFCRNFIALTDLITPARRALFERGTLVLGGREFHFAMRVRDAEAHRPLAVESGIFVLYVEVSYRYTIDDEAVKETVAVPVTRGTAVGLYKGRRGIFMDRQGRAHEAVIVDVVENPVSLHEVLLAPFERMGQYLSRKLGKWTEKLESDLDKNVTEVAKAAPPSPTAGGLNPLMAGTVALAAASSAFAFVTKQLAELGGPKILLALVIVCLLIAVPAVAMAAVRLHRRNLAGLIAASGWALNDRMRLTVGLGRLFTRRPPLPEGVGTSARDLVAERLRSVDPQAAWRTHTATLIRIVSVLGVGVLLFCVAMPTDAWPWLDWAARGAGVALAALLGAVLLESLRLKRFRAVFWWPVLAAPVGMVLSAVHALGG